MEELTLLSAEHYDTTDDVEHVRLETDRGVIETRFHPAPVVDAAVLWMFGSRGGFDGPAGGLYARLSPQLIADGISSLQLDYRHAGYLNECILDVLIGIQFLESRGARKIALVGHSFGAAVAIAAGVMSDAVSAVAALSSQTYGAGGVGLLSPRPLLLVHGEEDEVLSPACSRQLYAKARAPKEIVVYPRCHHGLDECRGALDRDLAAWLRRALRESTARGEQAAHF